MAECRPVLAPGSHVGLWGSSFPLTPMISLVARMIPPFIMIPMHCLQRFGIHPVSLQIKATDIIPEFPVQPTSERFPSK